MIELDKIRLRSVFFSVDRKMDCFPVPEMVVEELEHGSYAMPRTDPSHIPEEIGGQITLTLSGKGIFSAAGKSYECVPGTAFLYKDSDPLVSYKVADELKGSWRFVWMNFTGRAASDMIGEINRQYGYFFHLPDDELKQQMMDYLKYSGTTFFLSPLEGAKLFFDLMHRLCDPLQDKNFDNGDLIPMVKNEISKAFQEPFSTVALAKKIGVSREHMSRAFHRETGQTLQEFRAEQKLNAAIRMLLKSNCSCKEIAQHCNYGSYSSFYRAFAAVYGTSPEKFRKDNGRV